MATTVDPLALASYFHLARHIAPRVLIRQNHQVLEAWDYEPDEPDSDGEQVSAATVSGRLVFGGPPAPDVGDDITTWYIHIPVDVISVEELREMELAKEADEAAHPVYELGEQGQLVVAPDGSTVLWASAESQTGTDMPGYEPSTAPTRPRYTVQQPQISPGPWSVESTGTTSTGSVTASAPTVRDQLPSRRRTLARFARDYAKAWEDDEDPDLLGMLESNVQVAVRRVMEVTDP